MPSTILFDQFSDMDEPALLFWERLQESLAKHDLAPVLIHYDKPARPTTIPLIRSLADATEVYSDEACKEAHSSVSKEEFDLVCQSANYRDKQVSSDDPARRMAYGCKNFATAVLDRYQPALLVLWNGCHLEQSFLRRAAIERGIPIVYMDGSLFSGWFVLDEAGIHDGSSFGQLKLDDLEPVTESEQLDVEDFLEMVAPSPMGGQQADKIVNIHQKLNIPKGRELLTFFGQKDNDTQNFLSNSYFANNVQAWEWFLEITTQLGDGFHRLGKHHPQSVMPQSAYTSSTLERSDWRADLPLDAVIQQSQALASVNSSDMMDSMLARKRVLFLGGGSYYSGKQVAYEVHPEMTDEAIEKELFAWLYDSRALIHRFNLLRCVSHLLGHHMIAIDGEQREKFGLSIDSASRWFATHASESKKEKPPVAYSIEAANAYLDLYATRSELLLRYDESRRSLNASNAELAQELKKEGKALKEKNTQINKQKKEIARLKAEIHSAEKWQRSWVKRVFHRWRPKKR